MDAKPVDGDVGRRRVVVRLSAEEGLRQATAERKRTRIVRGDEAAADPKVPGRRQSGGGFDPRRAGDVDVGPDAVAVVAIDNGHDERRAVLKRDLVVELVVRCGVKRQRLARGNDKRLGVRHANAQGGKDRHGKRANVLFLHFPLVSLFGVHRSRGAHTLTFYNRMGGYHIIFLPFL